MSDNDDDLLPSSPQFDETASNQLLADTLTLVLGDTAIGARATAAIAPVAVSIHMRLNRMWPTGRPPDSATSEIRAVPSLRKDSTRSASSVVPNAASFT